MKKLLIIICLFTNIHLFSQRFLTYEYPLIDSIIGGTYGTAIDYSGLKQNLLFDFYSPHSDTLQKRPLIIYIHGGGFTSGSRTYPSVKLLCRRMSMKGYAVANIDYRLDPVFQLYNSNTNRKAMTDAMHDAKQAIRYFKANAALLKLDTSKIFIGGESAGAITAMMASYIDKQSEMAAYPLANPNNPVGSVINSIYSNNVNATMCLCGLILDTTAIDNAINPPLLWTHGSSDSFIPIVLAFNVVLRAAHIGLPIQTKVYQGATHCPWYYGNPNWGKYLDSTINDITAFLYPKTITLSKNEVLSCEKAVNIYPNPSNDYLSIDLDKQYSVINISVISLAGQTCLTSIFQNTNRIQLNLQELANGLYFIRIKPDNHMVIVKKIVIEN